MIFPLLWFSMIINPFALGVLGAFNVFNVRVCIADVDGVAVI